MIKFTFWIQCNRYNTRHILTNNRPCTYLIIFYFLIFGHLLIKKSEILPLTINSYFFVFEKKFTPYYLCIYPILFSYQIDAERCKRYHSTVNCIFFPNIDAICKIRVVYIIKIIPTFILGMGTQLLDILVPWIIYGKNTQFSVK